MAQFRVGQMVKVVGGPRTGTVTTIVSGPHVDGFVRMATGRVVFGIEHYVVNIKPEPGFSSVCAETTWLRPYDEGREKSDLATMPEWIRRLAGVGESA